jgi:hypothetical protein
MGIGNLEGEAVVTKTHLQSGLGSVVCALIVAFATIAWSVPAHAAIALIPAGIAQGLKLTTFATGYPNTDEVGPLGIAFTNTGGVLTTDKQGNIRLFPTSADNQLASSAPVTQNYGLNSATALAHFGGHIYMTRQAVGDVVEVNQDGTFKQTILSGLPFATGLVANPVTGHLYVSTIGIEAVYDIDPVAKTKTLFANGDVDGLSVSTDGSTLYLIGENGVITGYNTTTKAVVFAPLTVSPFIDGAVVGRGSLAGNLFVNTRDGKIIEVNLATKVQTTIADGGSRGDFAYADANNNSLLFTQTDSIVRLAEASVGAVPLPSGVWAGAFTGLGGLLISRRRRATKGARAAK